MSEGVGEFLLSSTPPLPNTITITMNRNPAVELYRVGAMFGIVLLHTIVQGGYLRSRGLDNVLLSCVTAFVFISGYFGIRFSVRKIIRLIALGCYCSFIAAVIGGGMCCLRDGLLLDIIKYHWFLWAYLVLMCFAPILNLAFDGELKEVLPRVAPILVVVFGWSYLAMIPVLKRYFPTVQGFGPLTPLTLIGIYLAARLSRKVFASMHLGSRVFAGLVILALPITWIGFGHYNSVASLVLAGAMFYLVEKLPVSERIGDMLAVVVPSLFPIYLLHCNAVGYEYLKSLNRFFIEDCHIWLYASYVMTAAVVFTVCFMIDLPRRFVLYMIDKRRK